MLDGRLEPPIRAHEGQRDGDLGVHGTQGPVLPEEEDRRLGQRDSNRHQDDDFEQDSEEQRYDSDKKNDSYAGLRSLQEKIALMPKQEHQYYDSALQTEVLLKEQQLLGFWGVVVDIDTAIRPTSPTI